MEDAARDDAPKLRKIRIDVQCKPVHRDPAADLHADCGDLVSLHPDSRIPFLPRPFNPEGPQGNDDCFLQASEVLMQVRVIIVQVENGISDDLAGPVIGYITTPVDFKKFNATLAEFVPRRQEVVFVSTFADGIDVLVLCQQKQVSDSAIASRLPELLLKRPGIRIPRAADIDS